MKKLLFVVCLVVSMSSFANLYVCKGSGYTANINSPEGMPGSNPAMEIVGEGKTSKVLARDLNVSANFEIEISGRTMGGNHVQYVSVSIDDSGVSAGTSVSGTMTVDTRKGSKTFSVNCVRGPARLP